MYSYGRRRTLVPRVQLTPTSPWNGDTLRDSGGIECIAGFGPYQKATSVSSVTSTHSLPCSALLFSASSSFIFFFFHINRKALVLPPSESREPCHRIGGRLSWICLTSGKTTSCNVLSLWHVFQGDGILHEIGSFFNVVFFYSSISLYILFSLVKRANMSVVIPIDSEFCPNNSRVTLTNKSTVNPPNRAVCWGGRKILLSLAGWKRPV